VAATRVPRLRWAPNVAAAIAEIADRVLLRVNIERGDALVVTPVAGIRWSDYLPTRTFELTVHTRAARSICSAHTSAGLRRSWRR